MASTSAAATDFPPTSVLNFSIHGCSEHSGKYVAENILLDNPLDQASRWSGAYQSPNVKQWILLRLDDLCVLKSITFGKFHKPHPCNMKEFRLFVGLTEDNMTEILHAGLKNDSIRETFSTRYTTKAGVSFPTRYVKIVPLSAHGQSFHTSIWYVSMSGISEPSFVEQIRFQYEEYRESVVLRHVLKHLRQRRFLTPFSSVLSRTSLSLEHPLISKLHDTLVLHGDWSRAEQTVQDASQEGLFASYTRSCPPSAHWTRLRGLDADGDVPSRRGGHALCFDAAARLVYLFGGWDGARSLDDFWLYDVARDAWRLLSPAAAREPNGPGPRACHKMVFDERTGAIYLLGRLGDGDMGESLAAEGATDAPVEASSSRGPVQEEHTSRPGSSGSAGPSAPWSGYGSEFYRYHTRGLDAGKWDLLSLDTAATGGPPQMFDHQMVIDSTAQMIYVCGGRIIDGEWDLFKFAGLYAYDIRAGSWEVLQSPDDPPAHPYIPPRFGHSMVFDPNAQTLFIFAGQRHEKYMSDMYAFHIPTRTTTELFSNFTAEGGPDACFTQRAVIDPELREIYVFWGLTRTRPGLLTNFETSSPYWIYRYERADRPGTWAKIVPEEGAEAPRPRYAHQVVYDARERVVYMHGGNAGLKREGSEPPASAVDDGRGARGDAGELSRENRLDDLWSMRLQRPAPVEVVRKAVYEIRKQQFREMCDEAPAVKALTFLQTEVSAVVDHGDEDEARMFRSLLSHLLSRPPGLAPSASPRDARTSRDAPSASRKRARADTPGLEAEADGGDTDMSDAGDTDDAAGAETPSPLAVVGMGVDPIEREVTAGESGPPSAERFKQRTQVFETLMGLVNEDARQPEKDLLDLIDTDAENL